MTSVIKPHSYAQIIVVLAAELGLAYYLFAFYLTLRVWKLWDGLGACLVFLLPYAAIAAMFLASFCLGFVRRLRASTTMLVLGILLSIAACVYDFKHWRYQAGGGGTGATYTIWWWYYEPFWYGYKPGNV